jgi:voltage-gated potassium channel
VSVITGDIDAVATYRGPREDALAVVANLDDATNTNVTLTVREAAPRVPIITIAEEDDSVDLLQLAGATHVMPLKRGSASTSPAGSTPATRRPTSSAASATC